MKLFTKSWRFYVAILFLVGGIASLFQLNVASFFAGLFVAVLLVLPDLLYFFKPARDIWSRWDESGNSQKQKDRIERARSGDLTPQWVDVRGKCARFAGSQGGKSYKTTLKKCSCPDFAKRGVPCKHMYYLADSCGLLGGDGE